MIGHLIKTSPAFTNLRDSSTRSEILRVALELFSAKGFGATSIREVAEKVGITKSTIYGHFTNKEKILECLLENCGPGAFNSAFKSPSFQNSLKTKTLNQILNEVFEQLLSQWMCPLDNKALKIIIIQQFNNANIRHGLTQELFTKERTCFNQLFENYLSQHPNNQITAEDLAEDLLSFIIYLRCEYFIFADTAPNLDVLKGKIKRKIERICLIAENEI